MAGFFIDGNETTGSKKDVFLDHLCAFWSSYTHPAAWSLLVGYLLITTIFLFCLCSENYLLAMYENEVLRKIFISERNEEENGTVQTARSCMS